VEKNIQEFIIQIPKNIFGIEKIKSIVVDDRSTDKTVDLALNAGADRIVIMPNRGGYSKCLMVGLRKAIEENADILVILKPEFGFEPSQVGKLVKPILDNQADVVVGSRSIKIDNEFNRDSFSNSFFSKTVSRIFYKTIKDTSSPFVAFSKKSMYNISDIKNHFAHEKILIDLKFKGLQIFEVPVIIQRKPKDKIKKSKILTFLHKTKFLLSSTLIYKPFLWFSILGLASAAVGFSVEVLSSVINPQTPSFVSLGFLIVGGFSFLIGSFTEIITHRKNIERIDMRNLFDELLFSEKDKVLRR
jgi:glycosyltransferase involved in cell wall biosynthesis